MGGVLSTCFVAVLGTCGYLQGCEHDAFRKEAEKNYLRRLRLDTQRGELFDRNGERLAASVEVPTIGWCPGLRVLEDAIELTGMPTGSFVVKAAGRSETVDVLAGKTALVSF